jgi:hypothetical protein
MKKASTPEIRPESPQGNSPAGFSKTFIACVAGAFIPGLGHALLRKWDRAIVFFACLLSMMVLGIYLQGRLFAPVFGDFFSTLKFLADAGSGLFYWIPWNQGLGKGDPNAYAYDYANVFIYVAGLLNMLLIVDVFDIALGRKQ